MPTKAPAKKKPAAAKPSKPEKKAPTPAIPIPTVLTQATTYPVQLVPTDKVHISAHNTRQPTVESVQELIQAIAAGGQITAAIARPFPGRPGHFELAAGARRRTACHALGIPLRIEVRPLTDDQLLDLILTENLQREDPDPFAEAALIKKRLSEGVTPEEVAAIYGKDARWISRRMKLNQIIPPLVTRLTTGDMQHYTLPMAELLGTLTPENQKALNQEPWTLRNCSSFTRLADHVAAESATLTDAVVKAFANPATHLKDCGPHGCSTASDSSLFPELTAGQGDGKNCAKCLNSTCFSKRLALAETAAITALLEKSDLKYTKVLFYGAPHHRKTLTIGGKEYPLHDEWDMQRAYAFHSKPQGQTIAIDIKDRVSPKLHWIVAKPNATATGKSGLTPAEKARAAIRKAAKAAGQKLTEDEITAAVRLTNHQRKRWKEVHSQLCTALEKSKAPDLSHSQWLMLFAAFGSKVCREFLNGYQSKHSQKALWLIAASSPPDAKKDPTGYAKFYKELWDDHFHDLLQSRLKLLNGMESFDDTADLRLEMTHVATLIGFDLDAAKKAADLQLPPPKSLGKVNPHTLLPL